MQAVNARELTQTRAVSALVIVAMIAQPMLASAPAFAHERETATPIKHVIVIIGENRTFDHIFATYQPVDKKESVRNLLSQGIVNSDHRMPTTAATAAGEPEPPP
jgi:phospholipase C